MKTLEEIYNGIDKVYSLIDYKINKAGIDGCEEAIDQLIYWQKELKKNIEEKNKTKQKSKAKWEKGTIPIKRGDGKTFERMGIKLGNYGIFKDSEDGWSLVYLPLKASLQNIPQRVVCDRKMTKKFLQELAEMLEECGWDILDRSTSQQRNAFYNIKLFTEEYFNVTSNYRV